MTTAQLRHDVLQRTRLSRALPSLTYGLWALARRGVDAMPLRFAYASASALATAGWYVAPAQRRNAIANYQQMLGPTYAHAAPALARRSFVAYAHYAVDFIRSGALPAETVLGRVVFDEWEKIDAVMARGKGCILVLMHFGDWDVGGQVLALKGYGMNAIAETQNGRINDDFTSIREARGARLIPMERGAAAIVRALRRGDFLAILIDRPLDEGGVEVDFFGAPVRLPDGPARLALRTGAAVVPAALPRIKPGSDAVRAILDFSIALPDSGDQAADVRELTQRVMRSHERIIRRHPEQWYMFRRFWPAPPA